MNRFDGNSSVFFGVGRGSCADPKTGEHRVGHEIRIRVRFGSQSQGLKQPFRRTGYAFHAFLELEQRGVPLPCSRYKILGCSVLQLADELLSRFPV